MRDGTACAGSVSSRAEYGEDCGRGRRDINDGVHAGQRKIKCGHGVRECVRLRIGGYNQLLVSDASSDSALKLLQSSQPYKGKKCIECAVKRAKAMQCGE